MDYLLLQHQIIGATSINNKSSIGFIGTTSSSSTRRIRRLCTSTRTATTTTTSHQYHRHTKQRTQSTNLFLSSRLELVDDNDDQSDDNNIILSSSEEVTPEILARWERMYQEGKEQDILTATTMAAQQQQQQQQQGEEGQIMFQQTNNNKKGEIRVITFDLDNTLWKTSGTINAANDVLNTFLEENNITLSKRIEKVMGELFQQDRKKYCPIECSNCQNDEHNQPCCKSPVLLTQLRTDAIRYVLETENGYDHETAIQFANQAFDIWSTARHDAIIHNMAPKVIETLELIKSTIQHQNPNNPRRKVLIGAITDGNSNPTRVDVLKPYFDFVVNAESIGVAKPDKRVYLEAVRTIITTQKEHFIDLLPPSITTNNNDDDIHHDEETLENIIGPYWCHIGDDFLKDIVAAKNMKMRSIWAIGLVRDKLLTSETTDKSSKENNESSMDMGEFMKKVSSQSVVSLGIGADDYLATSLTGEFVDAVADDFSDIGRILLEWHAESYDNGTANQATNPVETPPLKDDHSAINELPVTAIVNEKSEAGVDFIVPRTFRIVREKSSMDMPAPLKNRDDRTMKEVMSMAQLDKSSGVFALQPNDVAALQEGKKVLMIQIGKTDLQFSREIFSSMSVEEVLSLTDENPVTLTLSLKEAADQPSFDLF